jgi:hypothetical protein
MRDRNPPAPFYPFARALAAIYASPWVVMVHWLADRPCARDQLIAVGKLFQVCWETMETR